MSLPNPKQYVTEERLNEYHNIILPFLGGMPDILANKFARGDMYSTDEKMIGQWIDGKPLYQKTFTGAASTTNTTWYNIGKATDLLPNVETIVSSYITGRDSWGYGYGAGHYFECTTANGSEDFIQVAQRFGSGSENFTYSITLQYTKTTDSPVEIGIDTDYSTTEKIVGTWTDGRPVYQKTFYLENITINPQFTNVVWGNVPNIDILVNAFGMANGLFIPSYRHTTLSSDVTIDRTGGDIQTEFYRFGSGSFTTNAMLTVQYVKTV